MPLTRVTFRQLDAFVAVAELQSFGPRASAWGLPRQR
jgi:hypothetical protein